MGSESSPEVNPASKDVQKELCAHGTEAEQIAERVRYIFRRAGDNLPARELEQRLMVYRLRKVSE